MRNCVECGTEFDPEESYYSDICDECTCIQEGVDNVEELR